jgi:hypothetical protein
MLELKRPLKERSDVSPKFSPLKGVEGSLFINSDHHKIYCFLRDNPNEAFCGSEVKEKLKVKSDHKHCIPNHFLILLNSCMKYGIAFLTKEPKKESVQPVHRTILLPVRNSISSPTFSCFIKILPQSSHFIPTNYSKVFLLSS